MNIIEETQVKVPEFKFVNLTKHSVTDVTTGKTFPTTGRVARISTSKKKVIEIGGVPLYEMVIGTVEGIPPPQPGVYYIVSALCLSATDRQDVVSPGNLQRDEHNKPIGCMGFRLNKTVKESEL